jgi:hypothetical protein
MATLITPATALKYYTTCRLCHKRIAETDPLEIPLIGHPGRKVEKLMPILLRHLTKHHQPEFQRGVELAKEVTPFLILSAFDYEDPSVLPRLESIRAQIFAVVRKNSITDDSLRYLVSELGLSEEDAAKVLGVLTAVRNACCEVGEFAAG